MSKNKNNILAALILLSGTIIGVATALFIKENRPQPAGKVLEKVKEQVKDQGKIEGSWIDYDVIEYHGFDSRPLVYFGGLTIQDQDQVKIYQFAADVYTGEIIDLVETGK